MDGHHFDALAKRLSSRRTAIGSLVAGLMILPLEASARKKAKRRKGKAKQRVAAQDSCWRAAACIPGKNTNVSRCDLSRYTTFPTLDSTGSNLSRANLRGVGAQGVNFSKANLSYACLVDADFTGATFANSTNLGNAIFCRTKMPNGNINDSGCNSGTDCCPTCTPTTCAALGKTCGAWPNACGGTLSCGSCGEGATPNCDDGVCASCSATCGDNCGYCYNRTDGSSTCADSSGNGCQPCTTEADCSVGSTCVSSFTDRSTNETFSYPELCNLTSPGMCASIAPCSD